MRFRGLSEPLVGRVCSAKMLERHVGPGLLGPIGTDNPLVEIIGVALSDDEKSLMVHVHAATETQKFVGTTEVTVAWYERQFETSTIIRGSPIDSRAVDVVPCLYFENPQPRHPKPPSIIEMVKRGEVGFARELASRWFRGGRPLRKTEQLFLALLDHENIEVQASARAGLTLLVEALSSSSITASLKRKIGEICIVLGRLDPPGSKSRTLEQDSPKPDD